MVQKYQPHSHHVSGIDLLIIDYHVTQDIGIPQDLHGTCKLRVLRFPVPCLEDATRVQSSDDKEAKNMGN